MRLRVREGAQISAATSGEGQAGTLDVKAFDFIELSDTSLINSQIVSSLVTQTTGAGSAGDLSISTGQLIVQNGARVSAATNGIGNAGDMRIETEKLIVQGTGQVITATLGEGQGGNLQVIASDSVEVIGTSVDGKFPSAIATQTQGAGNAGNLNIETGRLIVLEGARVSATTQNQGQAGNLDITAADSIELIGISADRKRPSGLFASAEVNTSTGSVPTGNAGDLTIKTAQLIVRDGARASVSGEGEGAAGNLQVLQTGSVRLDNDGALTATTTAGDRGNITIQSQNLQMRHNSNITTNATNTANGGNITIDIEVLAALEDSNIRANAVRGDGGRVNITAQGVFGTEYRAAETSESDITASSTFGRQGEVTLNTPDVDPSRGLIALPEILDPTPLIAQGCPANKTSRFSITGRGGLPPNPSEALGTDGVVVNWVTLEPKGENISTSSTSVTRSTPTPSIEAQGFQRYANGDVLLTATSPTVTPYSSLSTPVSCHGR